MKKMSTLFVIDRDTNLATSDVRPENEWVLNGEGIATVKFDGSACMVKNGQLFKRWDRKLSKKFMKKFQNAKKRGEYFEADETMFKPLKDGAVACNESFDPVTMHWPHWVPVGNGQEDMFHKEAWNNLKHVEDGTFELMGPKVQGNLNGLEQHELWKHGSEKLDVRDFSFNGIRNTLLELEAEGIVFHHEDGRKCKIRRKDFFKFKEGSSDWRTSNLVV